MLKAILFLVTVGVCSSEIVRYDGHRVIQVQAVNRTQLDLLAQLQDNVALDFWTYPSLYRPTDIRVPPGAYKDVIEQLQRLGFKPEIIHEDVQKLIESVGQHPHADKRQIRINSGAAVTDTYPTYDKILVWAVSLQTANPNLVKVINIGKTYERRDTPLLRISSGGSGKSAFWIDAGIHAREWLAISTAINIIDKLVNGYKKKDATIMNMLNKYDFYILPVANPDGYMYSHTSGGRVWRKTRQPHSYGIGADPNRNWDYEWCVSGSSRIPTSDSYCGPRAVSEPCVSNMVQTLTELKGRMKVFLTIHTYGQMFFIPYAWSRSAYPPDYGTLVSVANKAVAAMYKKSSIRYRVGRVPDLLYEASGSSMDWVKGTLRTKYAFGMELRPSIRTRNGFIAPTSMIKPTADEVFEGLKAITENAV